MTGRTSRIYIRVSERERARIAARARRSGCSMSAYLRARALCDDDAPRIEVDAELMRSAHADLKRAGGLFNQLQRAINTYGIQAVPSGEIESSIDSVRKAADGISEALSALRPH